MTHITHQHINTHKAQNANEMLIIFQSGNFQNSTPVAVRVFKPGMLKLHGKEIQRMLGGERYNNVRRRKYKNVREKETQSCRSGARKYLELGQKCRLISLRSESFD